MKCLLAKILFLCYNTDMEIQQLKRLFWDIDEKKLSSLEERVVVLRTLSHGTLAQIQALFASYDQKVIREVFHAMKKGALSERRRDYFTLILS